MSTSASPRVRSFVRALKKSPQTAGVFNPWYDSDPDNDLALKGPQIRRAHLRYYLEQRLASARFLLIAEAIGYQGGHFSGMAMTSERLLLGYQTDRQIYPHSVFKGPSPRRSSDPAIQPKGFVEPTATIVWGSLLNAGVDPYEFVLWNAFPWHPYKPGHSKGMLTNRTPTPGEMEAAQPTLEQFMALFPRCSIIAIGKKCTASMEAMGMDCRTVRHPANGGATAFREQALAIFKNAKRTTSQGSLVLS